MNNILHLKIRYLVLSILILLILALLIVLFLVKRNNNPPGPSIQPGVIPTPSLTTVPNPNTYTGVDVTQVEEFRKLHPEMKTDATLMANLPVEFDGFTLDYSYPVDKFTVLLHFPVNESRLKYDNWLKSVGLSPDRFILSEGRQDTNPTLKPTVAADPLTHPDVFLENQLPHSTATYLLSSESVNGHYRFTVSVLKNPGKVEFLQWLKSLKLSDDALSKLEIVYK